MALQLTPTQIMFISVMIDSAIRLALQKAAELSEEEMEAEIAKEQARKDKLMAELKSH